MYKLVQEAERPSVGYIFTVHSNDWENTIGKRKAICLFAINTAHLKNQDIEIFECSPPSVKRPECPGSTPPNLVSKSYPELVSDSATKLLRRVLNGRSQFEFVYLLTDLLIELKRKIAALLRLLHFIKQSRREKPNTLAG